MPDDALLRPRPIDLPTTLPLDGPIDDEAADGAKIFAAPVDPADWPRWRERLREWREAARRRSRYDDAAYTPPSSSWASRCFSVALVWLWDERLYDSAANRFDVDGFIARTADYGGFDAVVLWQAYPIVGIDERTQFDFYRDVAGVARIVRAFHDRDIKVFVDYNPWDTAAGDADDHPRLVAALVHDLGADGVFLDTMSEGGTALRAALAALDVPPVLEGESKVSLARIADHQLSWAQWFADSVAPGVLRARWFERRHMLHHTRRWNRDHSDELQSSWMNGAGVLVWDAVFGSWVGWNERDRATLRSMLRAERALADVLTHGEWTPLVDAGRDASAAGVYASRFAFGATTLWTLVNRTDVDAVVPVDDVAGHPAREWFEVTTGAMLAADDAPITVPARGIAGVLAIDGEVPGAVRAMLDAAAADRRSADATFPARHPQRHPHAPSRSTMADRDAIVLEPGEHTVTITYRLRETGMYDGAPFVEAWKPLPPLLHSEVGEVVTARIAAVAVAASEVTNREFAAFVDATGYQPSVRDRFAEHWDGRDPRPHPGVADWADRPMTHVDLADARAYAAWRGARLPTELEWQLAAERPGFQRREPLVWNLTESEHSDGVTRFVILKGGSAYEPTGSEWYFDGGRRPPSFSAKLLLGGPAVNRSSRVGFRLAWDLENGAAR